MSNIDYMRLMIGDILMATYDDGEKVTTFPVVVDGLDENCTLVDGESYLSWKPLLPEHKDMEYADELELIPLTEEILKANGFEESSMGLVLYPRGKYGEDGGVITDFINICLRKDGTIRGIEISMHYYHFQCNYVFCFVHELQHALRLCGLNDIADKFKVTDKTSKRI